MQYSPSCQSPERNSVDCPRFASVCWLAVCLVGCAHLLLSSAPLTAQSSSAPAIRIQELQLEQSETEALLRVFGGKALRWLVVERTADRLVVDLMPATPAPSVGDLSLAGALVPEVSVEAGTSDGAPSVRLSLALREAMVDHIAPLGEELQIQLRVVAATADASSRESRLGPAAPEPPAEAMDRTIATLTLREVAAATQRLDVKSLRAPEPGATPAGVQARTLQEVEVEPLVGDALFRLQGEGWFRYKSLFLEDPPRFVLDLEGVDNQARNRQLSGSAGLVRRVRVSQFATSPRAITRVVFDLHEPGLPLIEPTEQGLTLRFGPLEGFVARSAESPASEEEPAAAPEGAEDGSDDGAYLPRQAQAFLSALDLSTDDTALGKVADPQIRWWRGRSGGGLELVADGIRQVEIMVKKRGSSGVGLVGRLERAVMAAGWLSGPVRWRGEGGDDAEETTAMLAMRLVNGRVVEVIELY